MLGRISIGAISLAIVLAAATAGARASEAQFPQFGGQWLRNVGAQWDPSKPRALGQGAPLTPEYLAMFKANLAEQASGGEKYNPQARCIPGGMPRMMIAYEPIEVIVTPEVTYIWVEQMGEFRRIYTDGRDWPRNPEPAFKGYSIGRWKDENGDGRYDSLAVETRYLKGPRTFDAEGTPLHKDNESIVKERLYLDRANPDLLYDEVTTFDHALTRPWTVTRRYGREHHPLWPEDVCREDNHHVDIGKESYFVSDDGFLMPTRKDQPPPDLKYFNAR
ncbi:MAG TPA: hypothetical protein VH684_11670 [Xanthobacteraceae bacterium]|jgi:hypothetical protein